MIVLILITRHAFTCMWITWLIITNMHSMHCEYTCYTNCQNLNNVILNFIFSYQRFYAGKKTNRELCMYRTLCRIHTIALNTSVNKILCFILGNETYPGHVELFSLCCTFVTDGVLWFTSNAQFWPNKPAVCGTTCLSCVYFPYMVDVARICVPLHQGGVSVLKGQFTEVLVGALLRNLRHLQSSCNQCVRTCIWERVQRAQTQKCLVNIPYFTGKLSWICLCWVCVKFIVRLNILDNFVLGIFLQDFLWCL